MKKKKRKKDKNKLSSSRYKYRKIKKNDIKISLIDKKRRRKKKQKIYMRRRLFLLLLLFLIFFILVKFIYGYFNQYKNYSYPEFRDNVLNSITNDIFVGNTEDRALTSAEKKEDFDKLYETIIRNYAIDKDNIKNFKEFSKDYDQYMKMVIRSKTDQEFYDIIDSYLALLSNDRTKIMDKGTYDMLFPYYKEDKNSPRAKVLGNSQVVSRYKRLIGKKSILPTTTIKENKNILEIILPSFNSSNLKKDIEKIKEILKKNSSIKNVYIDLSNNDSIDDKYAFKLLSLLIHDDYQKEKLIFYRGNLLKESLSFMKENKDKLNISSSFMKNPSNRYPRKLENINKDYYMYYDSISINIKKDRDIQNKNIYILTNENTKNIPILFSHILLKTSNAYLVKNTVNSEVTYNDKINYLRGDFFKLDHSGFVILIDDSYNLDEDDNFLNYNQKINTENPKSYVFENIK